MLKRNIRGEKHPNYNNFASREELIYYYEVEKKSFSQIGLIFDLSAKTVWRRFKDLGLPTRSRKEAYAMRKGKKLFHLRLYQFKGDCSWNRGLTKETDVRVKNISLKVSEAQTKLNNHMRQKGVQHWNWKGGYDHYYGPNWHEQRAKALERDGYHCQYPLCSTSCDSQGQNLDVHHIIPFRLFGIKRYKEANELTNLISLCMRHHPAEEHNSEKSDAIVMANSYVDRDILSNTVYGRWGSQEVIRNRF